MFHALRPIAVPVAAALLVLAAAAGNETVEVGTKDNTTPNNQVGNNDPLPNNDQPNNDDNNQPNNDTPNNQPNNEPACTDEGCGEGMICEGDVCVEGCRDTDGCPDGTICDEGQCKECTGDDDCTLGTICEDTQCVDGCRDDDGCMPGLICEGEACVAGCRDDEGCMPGQICQDEACVEGCRDDAACPMGQICEGETCADGCRDDAGCGEGLICQDEACVEGCREDAACPEGQLCLDEACIFEGIGCRGDDDCGPGDECDLDSQRCVPATPDCVADDNEPNDVPAEATALTAGDFAGLTLCPQDIDTFAFDLNAGEVLDVEVVFNRQGAEISIDLGGQSATENDNGASATFTAQEAGQVLMELSTADPDARQTYALTSTTTEPQLCVDTTVYRDIDMDGFGDDNSTILECLEEDQLPSEGFVRQGQDCGPGDALRHPDAPEICGDWVDDNCDGSDAACPTTRPGLNVPDWNCTGDAPSNVYAWARFEDGEGYFQDGGCFFFFEGAPGEFYVKRNIERVSQDPNCERQRGCVCPSLNGWPSYDRRMYAFTSLPDLDNCEEISIRDHAGEEQPVSNGCRKYLYQMHFYDIPFSFIAADLETLQQRLTLHSTIEIACVEDAPHRNLPFQSLIDTTVEFNPDFVRQ